MRRRIAKYAAIGGTQARHSLAYRGEVAARGVAIVLFMWVFANLWRAVYASGQGPTIAGMTLADTLWYLMLAESMVLSQPRLAQRIGEEVRDGSVAYVLNKPYSFLGYHLSVSLGDGVVRFLFNIVAGGAVVWLMVGPPPGPAGWPLVAVAVLLGWLVNFAIAALIGLTAFVTEDVSAFVWIYSKLVLILGGVLLPLDFFPPLLRQAALALPFAYTVYAPARLFVSPDPQAFATVVTGQIVWLVILGMALALVQRRSAAWLSINGG